MTASSQNLKKLSLLCGIMAVFVVVRAVFSYFFAPIWAFARGVNTKFAFTGK